MVESLRVLLNHWSQGILVHGPIIAWGQQRGAGFYIEDKSQWVLPNKTDSWNWSDHVKEGVAVTQDLCTTFGIYVTGSSSSEFGGKTTKPQVALIDRSSANFGLLRTKYPRVEWDETAKVDELSLHIHDQRFLTEYEWVYLTDQELPGPDSGMFFMPGKGTSFCVQGRLQYFWAYFTQGRGCRNDVDVKKIGCDSPPGTREMVPMSLFTLTSFPGGGLGQGTRDTCEGPSL